MTHGRQIAIEEQKKIKEAGEKELQGASHDIICPVLNIIMCDPVKLGVEYKKDHPEFIVHTVSREAIDGMFAVQKEKHLNPQYFTHFTSPFDRIKIPLIDGKLDIASDNDIREKALAFLTAREKGLVEKEQSTAERTKELERELKEKESAIQNLNGQLVALRGALRNRDTAIMDAKVANDQQAQVAEYERLQAQHLALESRRNAAMEERRQREQNLTDIRQRFDKIQGHIIDGQFDQARRQLDSLRIGSITSRLLDNYNSVREKMLFDYYCYSAQIDLLTGNLPAAINAIGPSSSSVSAASYRNFCVPYYVDINNFTPGNKVSDLRVAHYNLLRGQTKLFENVYADSSFAALQEAICIYTHYQEHDRSIEANVLLGLAYLKNSKNQNYEEFKKQLQVTQDLILATSLAKFPASPEEQDSYSKQIRAQYPLLDLLEGEVARLVHKNKIAAKENYENAQKNMQALKDQGKRADHIYNLIDILTQNGLATMSLDAAISEVGEEKTEKSGENQQKDDKKIFEFKVLIELCDRFPLLGKCFVEHGYTLALWARMQRGIAYYTKKQYAEAYQDYDYIFNTVLGVVNTRNDADKIECLQKYSTFLHSLFMQRARILAEHPELFTRTFPSERTNQLQQLITEANLFIDKKVTTDSKSIPFTALFVRAAALLEQGNINEAINDYNELAKMHSKGAVDVAVYDGRAKAYLKAERYKDAIYDCIRVLRYDGSIADDLRKTSASKTVCDLALKRLLADPGQVDVSWGLTLDQLTVVLEKFTTRLERKWPANSQTKLVNWQPYRDAYAYRFCAHAALADQSFTDKKSNTKKSHLDAALEVYEKLCTLMGSNVLGSHTLAHHTVLDLCKAFASSSDHYDDLIKVGTVVIKHNPALKVSVIKYFFTGACSAGRYKEALNYFNQLDELNALSDAVYDVAVENFLKLVKSSLKNTSVNSLVETREAIHLILKRASKPSQRWRLKMLQAELNQKIYYHDQQEEKAFDFDTHDCAQQAFCALDESIHIAETFPQGISDQDYRNCFAERGIFGFQSQQLADEQIKDDLMIANHDTGCSYLVPAYLSVIMSRQAKPELDRALSYATEAFTKAQVSHNIHDQAVAKFFLAKVYFETKKYQEAFTWFNEIENAFDKMPNALFPAVLKGENASYLGATYLEMASTTSDKVIQTRFYEKAMHFLNKGLAAMEEKVIYHKLKAFNQAQVGALDAARKKDSSTQSLSTAPLTDFFKQQPGASEVERSIVTSVHDKNSQSSSRGLFGVVE